MKRSLLFLVFSISIGFVSFGQPLDTVQNNDTTNWVNIQTSYYSVSHPIGWTFDSSKIMNTTFFIMTKLESEQDSFRENINFIVDNLKGRNITLDKYVTLTETQLKRLVTNFTFLSNQRIARDSTHPEYHKIVYTATQGIFNLKIQQRFWIANGNAYVTTLSCKESTYSQYQTVGERIMSSIQVID